MEPGSRDEGSSATRDEGSSATRRLLTDAVDVRFGRRGSERTRRRVNRLEPLPTSERAVATFLGATLSGHSAVFLLDDGLAVEGDGSCEPSPEECTFLTLREDRTHDQAFLQDDQGRKYSLKLLALARVPVAEARERATEIARTSRSERRGGVRSAGPVLGPTVEVTGGP